MAATEKNLQETTVEMDNQVHLLAEQVNTMRSLLAQFVTRDELQNTLVSSITNQLTTRLNEMDTAHETRHGELARNIEQRFESVATKEEVAGVITASAENSQRLTILEATAETRLAALEKRADQSEEIQKKQTESIQSMSRDTASIKDSVEAMQRTYSQAMELDKKRQQDVDRDLTSLKDADAQHVKDTGAIRLQVSGLDSGVNALRGDVAEAQQTRAVVTSIKTKQDDQDTRLDKAENTLTKLDTSFSSILWFFNNPDGRKVGGVLLGIFFFTQLAALFLLWRIATLGILAQ